jgi:hypothetical protein
MVFGFRKSPGATAEEPTAVETAATTAIDEKGETVQSSGIDVDASLDQLKKFKKTHQWVSFACVGAAKERRRRQHFYHGTSGNVDANTAPRRI